MKSFTVSQTIAAALVVAFVSAQHVFASMIPIVNPGFETAPAGGFPASPGYAPNGSNPNTYIPGWSSNSPDAPQARVGLAATGSAFADDGVIPEGTHVAFIQSPGAAATLFQVLPGLTPGDTYTLTFYDNARQFTNSPSLTVTIGTHTVVSALTVTPVDPFNVFTSPYHFVSASFTADAGDVAGPTLTFSITGPNSDDSILLDDISLSVPEPASMGLVAVGGLMLLKRRR